MPCCERLVKPCFPARWRDGAAVDLRGSEHDSAAVDALERPRPSRKLHRGTPIRERSLEMPQGSQDRDPARALQLVWTHLGSTESPGGGRCPRTGGYSSQWCPCWPEVAEVARSPSRRTARETEEALVGRTAARPQTEGAPVEVAEVGPMEELPPASPPPAR